ncbi:hypothetical protein RV09_GL001582 [Enterococcus moraviensis]|nr:hypothetical protein RV09_GL001582 [Enterococcus moraviensis]
MLHLVYLYLNNVENQKGQASKNSFTVPHFHDGENKTK